QGRTISDNVRAIVAPATPHIFQQALDEGIIKIFMDAGFCVTNPTCGACLGMSNGVLAEGEICASTTNRNFNGRMGKGGTIHLMSPATAAATAIAGHITNSNLFKWKK
ncbi:MAG: 3-isopropylmalate dehydratase, partial [Deltaproteobacteria bacterium]|nr:3-isopropylmalate dehydratase [Deltaproteobacteria bacterium]